MEAFSQGIRSIRKGGLRKRQAHGEIAEIAVVEYETGIYLQDRATVEGEIMLAESDLKQTATRSRSPRNDTRRSRRWCQKEWRRTSRMLPGSKRPSWTRSYKSREPGCARNGEIEAECSGAVYPAQGSEGAQSRGRNSQVG